MPDSQVGFSDSSKPEAVEVRVGYAPGYDKCSYCFGYGLVTGYNGEPTDCGHCGMSGIERKRDEKGRYAS